ncbi:hypothetical protein KP509_38G025700 [Ceratopteris richardii]|nr:hypothetical protein KP509_38G025700 [Ceratopteris richardii]
MHLKPPFQLHSRTPADLVKLNQALVYGILTQQQSQQLYVMHLAATTRDGYAGFTTILIRLVQESYLKLLDQPRHHLLWLVKELIGFAAAEVDTLCLSLLRRIVGGDTSHWNVWLAGQMLNIFSSNWTWLVDHSSVLTGALFTFLRLLPDHFMSKSPDILELRHDEIVFCVKILRERFQDCLVIGRDLVRLLQDVACIREFESIWKDLLSNPSAFNAIGFSDIAQLYVVRTPNRYLTSRLTPEMETYIRFILTHVQMGAQQRYQTWFVQRFLNTPESETLVCDLIRFICCAHHPPNQILQSDIIPRWAVIGWLLKCCKSHHVEANAKLALFYDWLFFMKKTDNLMNIEPALLLMVNSIPKYVGLTHCLLEFLFLCMNHYDPGRKDLIWCGVTASIDILIEKGVVQSLVSLSSSPHLAASLKKKLIECFPTYCHEAKGMSKVSSTTVIAVQSTHSKRIEAPPNIESKQDTLENHADELRTSESAGQMNMEFQNHSVGSPPCKRQKIGSEDTCSQGQDVILPKLSTEHLLSKEISSAVLKKEKFAAMKVHDDLSVLLQGSHKEAVVAFQKFLSLNLFKSKGTDNGENLDDRNFYTLARDITNILKRNDIGFCVPLHGYSPDLLEEDEIMSVTSVVFRAYTQSFHPKLLQMLLSWHAQGFDVGARLLCYSCRLAEYVTTFRTTSLMGSKPRQVSQYSQEHEKQSDGSRRKISLLSMFTWHEELRKELNDMAFQEINVLQQAVELVCPVESKEDAAISMCFMAYKKFLKGLNNKGSVSVEGFHCDDSTDISHGHGISEGQADDLRHWLIKDLKICLGWSIPRLLSILSLIFNYLPDLCTGDEEVIKLLVSTMDPSYFAKLELKLSLKELLIAGAPLARVQTLIQHSLLWDCSEQQYLWRLLVAEWQNLSPISISELVKSCALFLKPELHCEAVSGLLSLLRRQYPTVLMIITILLLPKDFARFAAAVLATWMSCDAANFLGCLTCIVTKKLHCKAELLGDYVQHPIDGSVGSPLATFTWYLDNLLRTRDEQSKVELMEIRATVLKLKEQCKSNVASDGPTSSGRNQI